MCHIWLSLLALKFKNKMQTGKCCLKDYGSSFTVFLCLKDWAFIWGIFKYKETQGKKKAVLPIFHFEQLSTDSQS